MFHTRHIVLLTLLNFSTSFGLKCHDCNGIASECDGMKDYGMSLECEGSCVKHYEFYSVYHRGAMAHFLKFFSGVHTVRPERPS